MLSYTLIWLLAGSSLCLVEAFLPTAFVALMMGISALVVALLSQVFLGNLWLQIVVWFLLSTILVLLSRRFATTPRKRSKIKSTTVAETLTEIPSGKVGRVLYEGNSWRAMCDSRDMSLAANQRVYVVRREGTTLFVVPENILDA